MQSYQVNIIDVAEKTLSRHRLFTTSIDVSMRILVQKRKNTYIVYLWQICPISQYLYMCIYPVYVYIYIYIYNFSYMDIYIYNCLYCIYIYMYTAVFYMECCRSLTTAKPLSIAYVRMNTNIYTHIFIHVYTNTYTNTHAPMSLSCSVGWLQ